MFFNNHSKTTMSLATVIAAPVRLGASFRHTFNIRTSTIDTININTITNKTIHTSRGIRNKTTTDNNEIQIIHIRTSDIHGVKPSTHSISACPRRTTRHTITITTILSNNFIKRYEITRSH